MEILGKVFGSAAKVKAMRLFLLNKDKGFNIKKIAERCQVTRAAARKEVNTLHSVGFIKKRGRDYIFNPTFKYSGAFEELLVNSETLNKQDLINNLKRAGRVKLLVVSGIFIKDKDSRVDMLVVGDRLKKGKIDEQMKKFEAELGKELSYAVFNTKEFIYRVNMYDKLVRDILDFPHEVLLQARELSLEHGKAQEKTF